MVVPVRFFDKQIAAGIIFVKRKCRICEKLLKITVETDDLLLYTYHKYDGISLK